MILEIERENSRRRVAEAREVGVEREKTKESETDTELKRAAVLERADFLVKEVKTNQKQMQNILLNIQQVLNLIQQLRAQLQLADDSNEPSSVQQDKKKIAELKKKIADYSVELENMREDLTREQSAELKRGIGAGLSESELNEKAAAMVAEMIERIKM